MNRKLSIYLILPTAAAMICGCVRENLEMQDGSMEIRLGARVDAVAVSTKAALEQDGTFDNDLNIGLIRWDETDGNDSPAGRKELSGTLGRTPSNDGKFHREISISPIQYYLNKRDSVGFAAWYPEYSAAGDTPGNNWVRSDAGSVIHPADGTHSTPYMVYEIKDGDTDVMVSSFTKGTYSSGVPAMEFRHALCKYNIYAYAVDDSTALEWGKLKTVTLTNLPEQVSIALPADLRKNEDPAFSYGGKVSKTVFDGEKEFHSGLPSDYRQIFITSFLGGAPVDKVLGVRATTSNYAAANSVSIARNFRPGYVYNIFLKFSSRGIINAEVSAMDWEYDDTEYIVDEDFDLLTDLSQYGTANSYIVSSANRGYCFTGTVKGNGPEGAAFTGRNGERIVLDNATDLGNIDSVAIVRSDALMKKQGGVWVPVTDMAERASTPIIELVTGQLSNGRVIFRVLGNPDDKSDYSLQYKGNVKIAVFRGPNIVWSWHIWITDRPVNQGYSNGYVALDRNLGAVTGSWEGFDLVSLNENIAYTGLYYQWGRKDPFFPAPFNSGNQWEGVDKGTHPVYENRVATIEESARHPMTYYFDGTDATNNWTVTDKNSDHLWGYVSMRDDIVKTIYDPCPPGYRVPGSPLWETPVNMTRERVASGGKFAGYKFTIDGMIDIYYPRSGCIAYYPSQSSSPQVKVHDMLDEPGTESGKEFVLMYSATPYEPDIYGRPDPDGSTNYDGLAYHFRYNEEALGNDYTGVMTADPLNYHVKRSDAYPVRCVFEDSAPVITDLSEKQSANSYIVTKSGYYEFDATIRGNGVNTLNIVSGDSFVTRSFDGDLNGISIPNVDRVDVLWWQGDLRSDSYFRKTVVANSGILGGTALSNYLEGECPVTILDGGELSDEGKPLFYVRVNDNTLGNVGIAAYDEFDNIVWSWHLWICPDIKTVQLGDYTLMDRNIGATYCPESGDYSADDFFAGNGFLYQWGRKDPFFQPAARNETGRNTQPWFEKSADGSWRNRSTNEAFGRAGTLTESVENPLSYFNVNESSWQTWYDPEPDTSPVQDFWGYVGASGHQGNSFAKTMYDPCPPGYRIMQHDVFRSANVCNDNDGEYDGGTWKDGTAYYFYNYGYSNSIYLDDSKSTGLGTVSASGVLFPNTQRIGGGDGMFKTGQYGISSASPYYSPDAKNHATDKQIHCREIIWKTDGSRITIFQTPKNWMSAARAVRCQIE